MVKVFIYAKNLLVAPPPKAARRTNVNNNNIDNSNKTFGQDLFGSAPFTPQSPVTPLNNRWIYTFTVAPSKVSYKAKAPVLASTVPKFWIHSKWAILVRQPHRRTLKTPLACWIKELKKWRYLRRTIKFLGALLMFFVFSFRPASVAE